MTKQAIDPDRHVGSTIATLDAWRDRYQLEEIGCRRIGGGVDREQRSGDNVRPRQHRATVIRKIIPRRITVQRPWIA
jgi:hypothetical protein